MEKRLMFLVVFPLFLVPFGWGTKFGGDVPGIEGGIFDVPNTVCNDNGICDEGERQELCTRDCKPKPKCFNHWCEFGETPDTCPYDCSIPGNNCNIDPAVTCPFGWSRSINWTDDFGCSRLGNCIQVCNRNGICDGIETVRNCPDDCAQVVIDELQKSYATAMQQLNTEMERTRQDRARLALQQQELENRIQSLVVEQPKKTEEHNEEKDSSAFAYLLFFSILLLIGGAFSYAALVPKKEEEIPEAAKIQEPYVPYIRSLFLRTNEQDKMEAQLLQSGWHLSIIRRARRGR